jgi:cysteine desulfurase/selenocysteine lyase
VEGDVVTVERERRELDAARIRKDFPVFDREINGRRIVYLDSAASSQKPRPVLEAMERFYETAYAPTHRSAYQLATDATEAFESARLKVKRFVNAPSERSLIFTKNATEALNLVARSWGGANLREGDAVVVTEMEHHANIVPWQILAAERGFEIRWVPVTPDGLLDLSDLDRLLDGAKAFCFTAMSNVLGTINPVSHLSERAHEHGAIAVVDACQYVPHVPTDVQAMGADFVAFSAHKMCGPSGIGVLWGREELLEAMPPFLGGGHMIADVRREGFLPAELPAKFEAGTPPIAGAIGLGAAVDYLTELGMAAVRAHEMAVTGAAIEKLTAAYGDDIKIFGPTNVEVRGGALSFAFRDVHPHDVSQVLDQTNVCVRAGHHCAKPLMRQLGVGATARASFYVYNDVDDVDALVEGLAAAADFFAF